MRWAESALLAELAGELEADQRAQAMTEEHKRPVEIGPQHIQQRSDEDADPSMWLFQ